MGDEDLQGELDEDEDEMSEGEDRWGCSGGGGRARERIELLELDSR